MATTSNSAQRKAAAAKAKPTSAKSKKTAAPSARRTTSRVKKTTASAVRNSAARPKNKTTSQTRPVTDQTPVVTSAPTKQQQQHLNGRLLAAKFGDMVTVLMQSKFYEDLRLKDLRSYVVPPLMNNQYRIAEARKQGTGNSVPAALILWARVSDQVQDRLAGSLDAPFILSADEWTSGNNYWIIDAIGHEKFLAPLLTDLRKTVFAEQKVKYRAHTPDGPRVKVLDESRK